jgi:putative copper export protein
VRIINDFLHDISFALWPGAVLAVWTLRTVLASAPADPIALHSKMLSAAWILGASLAMLVVTGAVRLNYYELNLRSGTLPAKHRMVVIKHAAFTLLLVASTVWFWYLLPPVS